MAAVFKRRPDLQAVAKWGLAIAAGATALWIPFDHLKKPLNPMEDDTIKRILQCNNREGIYISRMLVRNGTITELEFQIKQKETESEEKQST